MIELYYGYCVSTAQLFLHGMQQGLQREFVRANGENGWQEFIAFIEEGHRAMDKGKSGLDFMVSEILKRFSLETPRDSDWEAFNETYFEQSELLLWTPKWMVDPINRGWPEGRWFADDSEPGGAALKHGNNLADEVGCEYFQVGYTAPYLHMIARPLYYQLQTRPAKAPVDGLFSELYGLTLSGSPKNLSFEYPVVSEELMSRLKTLGEQCHQAAQILAFRWRCEEDPYIFGADLGMEKEGLLSSPKLEPLGPAYFLVSRKRNDPCSPQNRVLGWWEQEGDQIV